MGCFLGISRVLGESWTPGRYPSADFRPIRKADCVSKKNPLQNTEGPSESVQEFAARINKLGTQIFQSGNSAQNTAVRNANDQLLQSRFISGLKNEIRRFVLSRDPLNLEESINAALIEEQNMKLNQIASEERSGLSSAQTENPVLSALADRLQEINLRVGRLQEASAVTARKSGGNYFNRRENVFKCFYCGIQGHRQAECRKRQRDERAARYQPPRRNAASEYSSSSSPRPGGRHVHFRNLLSATITQLPGIQYFTPLTEKDFNLSGLDNKIKNRLFQLLISHKSAFARSTVELSAAVTEHHRISLQHDYPIKCPIYKIPFNLRNEFRRQIADLEKAGIISKSNSQYNTPALFVKQKEKWPLVLDFRKLNEITVTQDFVIPTLDDILHEISGSNYFSALDMKSAFNQIPLHFADRHKTAFSTPDGDKYQFNRLCFGLKNSPKAFQSIAQEVLGDLLHHGALVYIDDIILFTKTIDEHFELLPFLLGRKFKVFTDHKPLAGFLSNKNPSSKILRWKLALEEFNYDIHYIRGSLNSVADHLSRYINNITIALPDSKDLINMQREDSVLSTIIQKIDQNDVSPQISNYFINGEGLLCHLSKRPRDHPGLTPLESRDCEKRFKPKESNSHIHNRINVNTLKVESEKQNSDEFSNLQYVSIFVENQPVTALIDSGCQIPVLNSSLIRVQIPSEEIITLSSCFGEQRMVEVKPINLSLNQHSPSLSVRTAISLTLTEEIIIHPSVYSEIKKPGHAKSDVLLSESGSSLGVHFNSNVPVSSVRKNSSYDLPHVKNFNTRNDLSSLVKNYKCNHIKSTKLKICIKLKNDIPVCQRTRRLSCSDNPSPMKSKYRRFVLLRRIFQPWQWKRMKKRNRFEQTSRTPQRKISMRSTKDQLVKKDALMPVKRNVFLWNLPDVEEMPSHDGETV
ncbi:retrovirus-related Pol polyprotein from transposon 17.6 [Trichonephila clavipes]|nr:retrovirus-related Pol polyprotein from transposon 17.6 [Trichonephila clavipes]